MQGGRYQGLLGWCARGQVVIAVRHGQIGESDKTATCPLSTTLVSVCRGRHTPLTRAPRAGLRRDSQCYHILPGGRCLSRLSAATAPSLGPPPPRWCSAAFCVPPPHAPPADAPPRTENLRLFCRACGAASQAPMPCEWRLFCGLFPFAYILQFYSPYPLAPRTPGGRSRERRSNPRPPAPQAPRDSLCISPG